MPRKSKSKSGLFEILKVKNAKSRFESTEVEIRIPKFQNFGLGLADLERQADEYEKKLQADLSPDEQAKNEAEWAKEEAEGDKFLKELAENMRASVAQAKKERADEKLPQGVIQAMELLAASLETEPDEPDPKEILSRTEEVSPKDFELFTVMPSDGIKWDAKAEAKIDEFIKAWPEVRPQVLKQAYVCYKKLYPELKDIFGDMPTFKFTMPKPTKPEVVEDIFSISMIYLRNDGAIGITGSCTWDEELGFGAVIKKGKVVAFGHADEGFC